MDWELFTRIVDAAPKTIETICLSGIGEPLMHPRIIDMVEYAGKSGRRVYMFTNGTLLKGELMQQLAKSSLVGLNVSIEPDAESARYYRDVDYDEIAANIRAFAAVKRKGLSLNLSLVMNEMHHERVERFKKEWKGIVSHIKVSPQMILGEVDEGNASLKCSELWRGNMDIKTNGNVSVCCFDGLEDLTVGNVETTPLETIMEGKAFRSLLQCMVAGKVPLRCRKCKASCFSGKHISRISRKNAK
jgi:radical SAM protein with 4Fe4S-binding SPASM domain